MGLKLSLKPNEKIAINGAVLTNGHKRTQLMVENQARILRESDIIQEEEANTPAKRVYLPIMLMYLEPDCRKECHGDFARRLSEFIEVVDDPECQTKCLSIAAHVANEDYYKALAECRHLMNYEKERLSHVA